MPGRTTFKQLLQAFRNRHDPECARTLADLSWWVLLGLGGIISTVCIAYSSWLLFDIMYGIERDMDAAPSAETISREQLQEALNAYQQRTMRYELLRESRPRIVDPSQ